MRYLLISIALLFFATAILADELSLRDAICAGKTEQITADSIKNWNDPDETPLTIAAQRSEKSLEALLALKADLNKRNFSGDTPLLAACKTKRWKSARLLLSAGANPNIKDCEGKTPLYYAAASDLETVRLILSKKGNPNSADSPLTVAARNGRSDILAAINKAGGNIWKAKGLLHAAAADGNAATMWYLLSKKMNPNQRDSNGLTPLHYAIENGRKDTASALLSKRAKIDALDKKGNTPVMRYLIARKENVSLDFLYFLKKWNAKFNLRNYNGMNAIQLAYPQKSIIQFLKANKCDINAGDKLGNTVLHNSVIANNRDLVNFYLSLGADIDARNRSGTTALDIAIKNDTLSIAVDLMKKSAHCGISPDNARQRLLIKAISEKDISATAYLAAYLKRTEGINKDVLYTAMTQREWELFEAVFSAYYSVPKESVESRVKTAIQSDDPLFSFAVAIRSFDSDETDLARRFFCNAPDKLITILLKTKGADACAPNGITPLMMIAAYGDAERLTLALSCGADIFRRDATGLSPVTYAAASGNTQTLSLLISKRADINRGDYDRWTPLMHAVNARHKETAEILLSAGAKPDAVAYDGLSPLVLAAINNDVEIKQLLETHGAKHSKSDASLSISYRLIKASENGKTAEIKALIPECSNIDFADRNGRTALFAACENGNEPAIRMLLAHNASVNIRTRSGETPLFASIGKDNPAITEILLQKGADSNSYDAKGRTPLMRAAEEKSYADFAPLVNAGANLNRKSSSGDPLLFYLLSPSENTDYMTFFLHRGADINLRDNSGRTALMVTCQKGMTHTAEFLMKNGADLKARDNAGLTAIDYAVKNSSTDIVKFIIDGGFSKSASGYALLGDQCVKGRKYREAISFYSKALKEDYTINVYANMGIAFYNLRGHAIAKRCLDIAIQKDPSDPAPYYSLATITAGSKNKSIPLKNLEEALQRGFKDYERINSEPSFYRLKKDPRFGELMKRYFSIQ